MLLADANGGWSVGKACEIISCLNDPRVVWEEACPVYGENVEVARRTGEPVMVDQCVKEAGLARKAVDDRLVSSLCIKPAFLGGLKAARDIRDYCASSNAASCCRCSAGWKLTSAPAVRCFDSNPSRGTVAAATVTTCRSRSGRRPPSVST